MNEIVKDEIKVYKMMQEHNKLDRSVAKEVLRMDLEFNKKLNDYIKFNEEQRYLLECYKKLGNKVKTKKKNKEVEFIKLIKQLTETEQDALYELEKLVYKSEQKEKMTDAEKGLLKVLLKYSI